MAAVILAKLAGQLRTPRPTRRPAAIEHGAVAPGAAARRADPPAELAAAIDALAIDGATARWNEVVTALYGARVGLGPATFDAALGVVRRALRARLDRSLRSAR